MGMWEACWTSNTRIGQNGGGGNPFHSDEKRPPLHSQSKNMNSQSEWYLLMISSGFSRLWFPVHFKNASRVWAGCNFDRSFSEATLLPYMAFKGFGLWVCNVTAQHLCVLYGTLLIAHLGEKCSSQKPLRGMKDNSEDSVGLTYQRTHQ